MKNKLFCSTTIGLLLILAACERPIATEVLPVTPQVNVDPQPTPTKPIDTPTPDPTRAADAYSNELYIVQSGDTLASIALEYGTTPEEIGRVNDLTDLADIAVGQPLNVPLQLDRIGSSTKLIPDSELVYGPGTIDFNVARFVDQTSGYLRSYSEEVEGSTFSGAQIVQLVAQRFSVNPRLLLAVIEYRGGWLTDPAPDASSQYYPAGHHVEITSGLYQQLSWAANHLNDGYYGWKYRAMLTLRFTDASRARIALGLNAGTVGVQEMFAIDDTFEQWQQDVGPDGFIATYQKLFGNPFKYTATIVPPNLQQPTLTLPWPVGETWYYTGGPHGGWVSGSGWAAIDFTPPDQSGCLPSSDWVVAAAPGLVMRSETGEVLVDLDGDGHEQTGWDFLYMHIADEDRVAVGTQLQAGDHIGHPSCTGGAANATHVHLARRYNGEWIPAAGPLPLVLDGWRVTGQATEYDGGLIKGDQAKVACECRDDAKNGVTR
jgi:LasA protease